MIPEGIESNLLRPAVPGVWGSRRLALAAGLLLVLLAASCGGRHSASLPGAGQPGHGAPPPLPVTSASAPAGFDLPALATLRGASNASIGRFNWGAELDPQLVSPDAVKKPTMVELHPNWDAVSSFKPSYAGYDFDMTGYSGPSQARTLINVPQGSADKFFYALANWQTGRWEWFAAVPNQEEALPDFSPYIRPADQQLTLVVLALGTDLASLVWTRVGTDLPPTLNPSVAPQAGAAPLDVTFDLSGCQDIDTYLYCFIDYEGTGDFVEAYNWFTSQHTYTQQKVYHPVLRITDVPAPTGGNNIDFPYVITVAGKSPVAHLFPSQTLGPVNTQINFDAPNCYDPDGTIQDFAWDFEGDGIYDVSGPNLTNVDHTYAQAGVFHPVLRVTDNANFQATKSVTVVITSGAAAETEDNDHGSTDADELPTAPFSGFTGDIGPAGQTDGDTTDWLTLHVTDPGVYTFTLDFTGAGAAPYMQISSSNAYETGYGTIAGSKCSFTNTLSPGDVRIMLSEADKTKTYSYSLAVSYVSSQLPVLKLEADKLTAVAPFTAHYGAAGSYDPDGTIVKYEWDCYGDGDFEVNTGTTPAVTFYHQRVGAFEVTLRATDDKGAQSYATLIVQTTGVATSETEPNDDLQHPQLLTLPVVDFKGDCGWGGQNSLYDNYKVAVSGACNLHSEISLDAATGHFSLQLWQLQANSQLAYISSVDSMATPNCNLSFNVPAAGTYVLALFCYQGSSAYTMNVYTN